MPNTDELMHGVEQQALMMKIGLAMRVIADLELERYLAVVEMAHTLGPFVDPTKYRDALQTGDMDTMAKLVESLRPAVKIWNEQIRPKLTEEV